MEICDSDHDNVEELNDDDVSSGNHIISNEIPLNLLQGLNWHGNSCPHDAWGTTLVIQFYYASLKDYMKIRFEEAFPNLHSMIGDYLKNNITHHQLKLEFVKCITKEGSGVQIGKYYSIGNVNIELRKVSNDVHFNKCHTIFK